MLKLSGMLGLLGSSRNALSLSGTGALLCSNLQFRFVDWNTGGRNEIVKWRTCGRMGLVVIEYMAATTPTNSSELSL